MNQVDLTYALLAGLGLCLIVLGLALRVPRRSREDA